MSDNISLDQVRFDDKFNFVSQYDSYNQFDVDDVESPLRSCNITNEYEPGQFCDSMKDSHNSMSYYLAPHRGRARYCNAHVCLFVCLSVFSQNFKV